MVYFAELVQTKFAPTAPVVFELECSSHFVSRHCMSNKFVSSSDEFHCVFSVDVNSNFSSQMIRDHTKSQHK